MDDNSLNPRQLRQVYLLTYSQADMRRFSTRESFANAVLEAFAPTPATIVRWVCGKEKHQDGNYHYHMAIKLDRTQRWLAVKNRLQTNSDITVNFSGHHHDYYSAWMYATKEDPSVVQSVDHPDLSNGPPHTTNASHARTTGGLNRKRSRMSAFDVVEVVTKKKIKNRLELLALANAQKEEGKTDLAEFICNRGRKTVEEAISTAWEMAGAQAALDREKRRRLDILEDVRNGQCVQGCRGQWYLQARDILSRNDIDDAVFAEAVVTLLREGRGKYRNILISGPTNCGKSFLISPLQSIFNTFTNPATTTYAWIGAESAEIIVLNDFRWTPQVTIQLLSRLW